MSPKKPKYFDAFILQEAKEISLVVYDLHQHLNFSDAVKKGVTITHLAKISSADSDDLQFTGQSKTIFTTPSFKHNVLPITVTTIKSVLTDVPMYNRVHIKFVVMSTDVPGFSKDMLPFQQIFISDNS